jgi:hypothetical protein
MEFQGVGGRRVVGDFDAGRVSSDAGGLLLLREVEQQLGLGRRLSRCFTDHRCGERVEHSVEELVLQRLLGLAAGYEDLNDHDTLRDDVAFAVAVGKRDITGASREHARDRGHPLAASSTLNRLELTPADATAKSRYHKIVYDARALDELLVDVFLQAQPKRPKPFILDLDATDDALHGRQEGRFFHGYYGHYCYLPLYIFCEGYPLCARLRRSNIDGAAGSLQEVQRIVRQLRKRFPHVQILLRGDSGFAREYLMAWCEKNRVDFLFGLARNARLTAEMEADFECLERDDTGEHRRFRELSYRTLKTWSRARRVVGKAELVGDKRNPRFVVTSLRSRELAAKPLYEELYCARGDMENRIKEQQLGMFADRTSTAKFRANQLRLYFSTFAYLLVHELRCRALRGTELEHAQCSTLRVRLFKIAAVIRVSVRRVVFSLSSVHPSQAVFRKALANLRAQGPPLPT